LPSLQKGRKDTGKGDSSTIAKQMTLKRPRKASSARAKLAALHREQKVKRVGINDQNCRRGDDKREKGVGVRATGLRGSGEANGNDIPTKPNDKKREKNEAAGKLTLLQTIREKGNIQKGGRALNKKKKITRKGRRECSHLAFGRI